MEKASQLVGLPGRMTAHQKRRSFLQKLTAAVMSVPEGMLTHQKILAAHAAVVAGPLQV